MDRYTRNTTDMLYFLITVNYQIPKLTITFKIHYILNNQQLFPRGIVAKSISIDFETIKQNINTCNFLTIILCK